jgi:hypothetical protein
MIYIKVIVDNAIYNFVVNKFFIRKYLGSNCRVNSTIVFLLSR